MLRGVTRYALTARYVFPVAGPPLPCGIVNIDGDRISGVSAARPPGDRPLYDLGNVALLPGLVNAHAHLNFSKLRAALGQPGMPFAHWLEMVVRRQREEWAPETAATRRAISAGVRESVKYGTTTLGNISRDGHPDKKDARDVDCTAFLELIGLSRERAAAEIERMARWLYLENIPRPSWDAAWRFGISPHAPYTARRELIAAACEASRKYQAPLAMHLAESPEELELLDRQTGPLVEVLQRLDAWDLTAFERGLRPLDCLKQLASAERALVIHGNYLDAAERQWLGKHSDRLAVVYCPRTHHYFGHRRYPLPELLSAGATVALGTDGRGSNPDLSLLAEMRHVARAHSEVPMSEVIRLGTLSGAKALGCDAYVGSLQARKFANLVAVRLPDHDEADPHALLLHHDTEVMLTMHRGRLVHPKARWIEDLVPQN
jgi:cytosine/adenosine deaminase-related metal-dependent hydrolase